LKIKPKIKSDLFINDLQLLAIFTHNNITRMPKQKYFSRYSLILYKLQASRTASFKEIKSYLVSMTDFEGSELDISKRTFDRDRSDILTLFNIEIVYDFRNKGYYVKNDNESEEFNNRRIEYLSMFNSLNMSQNLNQYVIFEKRKSQGTENFHNLLRAIRKRKIIRFTYTKFWDGNASVRTAEPYVLKEVRSRWYLLAKDNKDGLIKIFGLDRISNPQVLGGEFKYPDDYNANARFEDFFGIITDSENDAQQIILSFTPFQGKYIKSFPLHHSQQIIEENENEFRIQLKLHITKDFLMELFSYGDEVRVISPVSLRDKVCEVFENAVKKNKDLL